MQNIANCFCLSELSQTESVNPPFCHVSSCVCSVICPWTVIFSVIPGSHYAKCYSILSHCFLLHMKLFLWRLKTKKEKLTPYIAVLTTTASIPALMCTCRINWSAGGPLLPKVKGGWLKSPLVNASIRTNYSLSLHVDLSPVWDLIIGSDKGPGHTTTYNSNILSRNQRIQNGGGYHISCVIQSTFI